MIRLEHVSWRYEHAEHPDLRDFSLRIEEGEFVVLCGASGSGKSTALRVMNGLVPQFYDGVLEGNSSVAGLDVGTARIDELGEQIGTVLQHPRRQFFTGTPSAELAFASENFGIDPELIRSRVAEQLQLLGPRIAAARGLEQLSGGQQQQLAIAANTLHRPGIVLLDEPSSNLSSAAIERLVATLARLKANGVTVVIAEHRLSYLADLLDRVVVLRGGRIDRVWNAAQFRGVGDAELAREGLRGAPATVALPTVTASGNSVVCGLERNERHATHGSERGSDSTGLELHDIRCARAGRVVLEIDHAFFPAGRVSAIRGENGAGKSTLARIITGLQRSQGSVTLSGRRLSRSARQRASALVMQDVQRQLFTDSVAAEVELSEVQAEQRRSVLRSLGLEHLADRHPLSLSGGQQQRLVVASVRLSGRRVVVFDEPSSGVDRRHLNSIAEQLRMLADEGAVVLVISHDEDLLALAADEMLTLRASTTQKPLM